MTRPRARPKPGRYYVVVTEADIACEVVSDRDIAQARASVLKEKWGGPHRTVECVPMPRVTLSFVGNAYGDSMHMVSINGVDVASMPHDIAKQYARDLRRALRGK